MKKYFEEKLIKDTVPQISGHFQEIGVFYRDTKKKCSCCGSMLEERLRLGHDYESSWEYGNGHSILAYRQYLCCRKCEAAKEAKENEKELEKDLKDAKKEYERLQKLSGEKK